ncbi:rhomboid family intramembrane serine protease [Burkholderiaceae bacterium DAT-1]|nr:rhomboid family intramembrane serine protease [Burkholderiaceae bacterium DAT-1]
MLVIPLPNRPNWRNPPWVTLCLIISCVLIYFGFQLPGERAANEGIKLYQSAGLGDIELPRYQAFLQRAGAKPEADAVEQALAEGSQHAGWVHAVLASLDNQDFQRQLQQDLAQHTEQHLYADWQRNRKQFDLLWAKNFTWKYALHPRAPTTAQVFMQMFMHGSIDHLVGNMVILFMVAYTVEALIGGGLFLLLYVLAGVCATLPDLIWPGTAGSISLGASGAIAGVMAMFVMLYGLRKVRFFYWIVVYFSTMRAPAILVLPWWLAHEVWQRLGDPESHVNYWAHFAGLCSGTVFIAVYRLYKQGKTAEALEVDDRAKAHALQRELADDQMRKMEFAAAARSYISLFDQDISQPEPGLLAFRAACMQPDPNVLQEAAFRLFQAAQLTSVDQHAADTAKAWQMARQQNLKLPQLSLKQWVRLLSAWIAASKLDEAEQLLARLISREGDHIQLLPALVYKLGMAHRVRGDKTRSLAAWTLLKKHFPESVEARMAGQAS